MDASPPESNGTLATAPAGRADAVAATLEDMLVSLDELGHTLAGCYVSMAIELMRAQAPK